MKGLKIAVGLVTMFVTIPIWYWLVYQILERVQATQLMWFLYWVYAPVGMFVGAVAKFIEVYDNKDTPCSACGNRGKQLREFGHGKLMCKSCIRQVLAEGSD